MKEQLKHLFHWSVCKKRDSPHWNSLMGLQMSLLGSGGSQNRCWGAQERPSPPQSVSRLVMREAGRALSSPLPRLYKHLVAPPCKGHRTKINREMLYKHVLIGSITSVSREGSQQSPWHWAPSQCVGGRLYIHIFIYTHVCWRWPTPAALPSIDAAIQSQIVAITHRDAEPHLFLLRSQLWVKLSIHQGRSVSVLSSNLETFSVSR